MEFWLYLKNGKVNFYDFFGTKHINHNLKYGKFVFSNFSFIFEKTLTLQ